MSCSWCMNRSFMVLMSLVKSPIARILFGFGNTTRGPFVADTPICSVADTRANQLIARLFLAKEKSGWNIGNIAKETGGGTANAKVSHPRRKALCTACDSHAHPGPKLELSRTAQRGVFALWVFACGAIGRRFPSIASKRLPTLLPPCREDECTEC